jgi:hypothetical protein
MAYIIMRKIPDSEDREMPLYNSYDSFDIHSSGDWEAISRPLREVSHARRMLDIFSSSYRTGNKLYLFQIMEETEVST